MHSLNKHMDLLLSLNQDIANIKDRQILFPAIFNKLRDFYGSEIFGIAVCDKKKETIEFTIGKNLELKKLVDSDLWFQAFSVDKIPFELSVNEPKVTYVEAKYFYSMQPLNNNQSTLEKGLKELNINSFSLFPMRTEGEFMGYLIIPSSVFSPDEKYLDYLHNIANLIGSALKYSLTYIDLENKKNEREIQFKLLRTLVKTKEMKVFYKCFVEEIDKLIPCDYVSIYAKDNYHNMIETFSLYRDTSNLFEIMTPSQSIMSAILALKGSLKQINDQEYSEISDDELQGLSCKYSHIKLLKEKHYIKSLLVLYNVYKDIGELILIIGRKGQVFGSERQKVNLLLVPKRNKNFAPGEIEIGNNLLPSLGVILSNIHSFEEIQKLTKKLEQENSHLLDEINLAGSFHEIIGRSQPIQNSLNKVKLVAPFDTTVLILGETGTGKELIARAVHNLSNRKEKHFITVNCAAIPAQLIESELFGHEKGSFTGAIEKRLGKFELAEGGTIFLDEIGELPLEIQAKLLRGLQEKEFERIGGKSTIHADVRIIAATNRKLEEEVSKGKFRSDLFYRLNVFPITVPPLRERKEDIPLLAKYFIDIYSKRIGKNVTSIRKIDLDILMDYDWPGNVRELEHLIERAIITSEGSIANLSPKDVSYNHPFESINRIEQASESFKTLIEIEKEHIIKALKASDGKITGENSASKLLGINGKTLGSRMRKLGIKRIIDFNSQ